MSYEGMLILDPDLGGEGFKKALNGVSEAIVKEGGTVSAMQELGRKRMGHPARKKDDGFFVVCTFTAPPGAVERLQKQFVLNESILRFMITRLDTTRVMKIKKRTPLHKKSEAAA